MNIPKTLIIIFLAAFFSTASFAQKSQDHASRCEQIESIKIGYLTQKLSLTTEEAQSFWPVYNEYRATLKELKKQKGEKFNAQKDGLSGLSENELTEMVDNKIIFEQKELDIKKKYHAAFKNVLPVEKVALLYKAEYDFKKHLLNEAQKRQDSKASY